MRSIAMAFRSGAILCIFNLIFHVSRCFNLCKLDPEV